VHGECHSQWLSVPVNRPGGRETLIKDVGLVEPGSTARMIKCTLLHAFRRAPYWNAVDRLLRSLDSRLLAKSLTELCVCSTLELLSIAGRRPETLLASRLPVEGNASSLIAEICKSLGAGEYLADSGARNYLKPEHFSGVDVLWQDWVEPQERSEGIDEWRNVSSVNYLCRFGPERFKKHLLEGRFDTVQSPATSTRSLMNAVAEEE
jgi:hypothetical protein